MTQTVKVAVIGTGNISKAIAANLSKSNRTFIVADKSIEKTKAFRCKPAREIPASFSSKPDHCPER